jgi:hypothetical protein
MSARRSIDYDIISLQTIRANAPAYTSLTSDGLGGTYWSTFSSGIGYLSSFRMICTPSALYVADASYNIMSFNAGQGIQFIPSGKNTTRLVAHAFNEINIDNVCTLSSGQTNTLSTLRFSTIGNTFITTNSNTLSYEIRHPTFRIENALLPLNDQTSSITFIGRGDILLSTFSKTYFVGLQISTFKSKEYGEFMSTISTLSTATVSTISSLYTYMSEYSTAIVDLSTTTSTAVGALYRSTISTQFLSTVMKYSTLFSKYYTDISNSFSTFSTSLYKSAINTSNLFLTSLNVKYRSAMDDIQDMSGIMVSSFATLFVEHAYPVTSTSTHLFANTELQSTANAIYQASSNSFSTVAGLSNYALNLGGAYFSTFSRNMISTFSTVKSTDIRREYRFFPPYTTYNSQIQTASGLQYDILLSTCEVSLAFTVPYIDTNSRVFLDYTPSYSFKTLSLSSISTNTYPMSTFLTYDSMVLNESIFTDTVSFNILSLTATYQDVYSRPMRLEINADCILEYNTDPYIINHFHSSIVNLNNTVVIVNQPNVYGGIVVPTTYITDCDLNLYTTTQWSNSMSRSNAISVYIHNGVAQ